IRLSDALCLGRRGHDGNALDAAEAPDLRGLPAGEAATRVPCARFRAGSADGDRRGLVAGRRGEPWVAGPYLAHVPDGSGGGEPDDGAAVAALLSTRSHGGRGGPAVDSYSSPRRGEKTLKIDEVGALGAHCFKGSGAEEAEGAEGPVLGVTRAMDARISS